MDDIPAMAADNFSFGSTNQCTQGSVALNNAIIQVHNGKRLAHGIECVLPSSGGGLVYFMGCSNLLLKDIDPMIQLFIGGFRLH
jgi:hypothetical protein